MSKEHIRIIFAVLISIFLVSSASTANLTQWILKETGPVPFDMGDIYEPSIPKKVFNIVDYNAHGNGLEKNTNVFEKVIQDCEKAGGGRILIPEGIWLTGPIDLKSNMELYLEKGAVLLFSTDLSDYPLVHSSFEGIEQVRSTSPINIVDAENVAITGSGIIDGSGGAWRPVKRFKMTNKQWNALKESGGIVQDDGDVWWPSPGAMQGAEYIRSLENKPNVKIEDYLPAHDFLRPVMVRMVNSKNILLDGPTFQNSAAWNIHPLLCENIIIRNITVRNPWFSQNGDGLDLESTKNVLIYDCNFDVGDDAICIKSGRDAFGRERGKASENIIIYNCTVYHGHGGVTTGSEMSGGVNNVWVSDCTFIGTDVGLRFKSIRGRGGVVENMYFRNIQMIDVLFEAILFDLFYENIGLVDDIPKVDEGTPIFRNIDFDTISSINAETSVFIRGLPELFIHDIRFSNMEMSSEKGVKCIFVEKVQFENTTFTIKENPVIEIMQGKDISFTQFKVPMPEKIEIHVDGEKSENIKVDGDGFKTQKPIVQYGDNVDKNVLVIE